MQKHDSFTFARRMGRLKPSVVREILKTTESPEIISFAGGLPAPELFPAAEISRICAQMLIEDAGGALQYGVSEGYRPLREWVSSHLASVVGVASTTEQILITSGSQQALDLIGKVLIDPGDVILVEDPSYLGALQAFGGYEANIVPVRSDTDGLCPDALRQTLVSLTTKPKLLYLIPNFHNPTGVTTTAQRRRDIAAVATEFGVPVVEDDPYGRLRYSGEAVPALVNSMQSDALIYLGTSSKILAPGLRVAWMVIPDEAMRNKIVTAKQSADLHTASFTQRVVHRYVSQPALLDDHLTKLTHAYRQRRDAMASAIEKHFPQDCQWSLPQGGLFFWVKMKPTLNAMDLLAAAIKQHVAFVPGHAFSSTSENASAMRLNFSNASPERIEQGISRLGGVLKTVLLIAIGFVLAFSAATQADDTQIATGGAATQPAGVDASDLDPSLKNAKFLDPTLSPQQRVDDLFPRLTPLEKISLLHGCSDSEMGGISRLRLRKFKTTDGPQGVRGPEATEFPSCIAMAAAWDPAVIAELGTALGEETLAAGSSMQLGPGMNIMRTPLGGRSFEYMGEDPLLTGKTAAGYVRGMQSIGVSACIKHFTGNEQEAWRTTMNVQIPERALREIYARPFEICIRESHPWAIMAAYNKLNGDYCCHSHHLLTDLLRHDWNWDGQVVSDWGAWHDTAKALKAGCDIEMGGYTNPTRDGKTLAMIANGRFSQADVDSAVRATLLLMFRVGAFDAPKTGSINTPQHQAVARKVADDSIVLLKNSASLLPLDAGTIKTIAVVGPAADWKFTGDDLRVSGGSGAVFPPYEITALAGVRNRLGDKAKIVYEPGFEYSRDRDTLVTGTDQISKAVEAARGADAAIVCVGTNHAYDRESLGWGTVKGADKPDLNLIGPASELVKAVAAVNPHTVVVLTNGSPVSVEDWIDSVPAVIECWYPGMEGGNAIADVLFGDVNPSGKLPCTFGKKLTDWKCHTMGTDVFPGTGDKGVEKYDDGIWVGYRHFDRAGIEPRFPFGFGLSYTTFKLENPSIETEHDGSFVVKAQVTNTGAADGAEVVQVYMSPPKGDVERPVRELAGFAKVSLSKGQSKTVSIPVAKDSLAYWDEASDGWKIANGEYTFRIGTSSRDLPLSVHQNVQN